MDSVHKSTIITCRSRYWAKGCVIGDGSAKIYWIWMQLLQNSGTVKNNNSLIVRTCRIWSLGHRCAPQANKYAISFTCRFYYNIMLEDLKIIKFLFKNASILSSNLCGITNSSLHKRLIFNKSLKKLRILK